MKAKALDEQRWNHVRAGMQHLQTAFDHLNAGLNSAVASLTGTMQMRCDEDATQFHMVSRVQHMYKSQNKLQDILAMVATVA